MTFCKFKSPYFALQISRLSMNSSIYSKMSSLICGGKEKQPTQNNSLPVMKEEKRGHRRKVCALSPQQHCGEVTLFPWYKPQSDRFVSVPVSCHIFLVWPHSWSQIYAWLLPTFWCLFYCKYWYCLVSDWTGPEFPPLHPLLREFIGRQQKTIPCGNPSWKSFLMWLQKMFKQCYWDSPGTNARGNSSSDTRRTRKGKDIYLS